MIPGVIGGIIGAYVLTGLAEEVVKPIVTVYLLLMAVLIFMRVLAKAHREWNAPIPLLGTAGGFLDAIGGGGWGPIVTSTLLASGDHPRRTIGTVNTAEFIITTSISITFLTQLDLANYGQVVLGLIAGGASRRLCHQEAADARRPRARRVRPLGAHRRQFREPRRLSDKVCRASTA